ncbi:MAG: hypothetical protein HY683_08225 [Chloroflexi bacterium]|nr:hypothetical protein [Chloroflexota bacterium]
MTIPKGTYLSWTNADSVVHTITAGSNGVWDGVGWDRPLAPGDSFSQRFTVPGAFPYTCRIHPFMNATITVLP